MSVYKFSTRGNSSWFPLKEPPKLPWSTPFPQPGVSSPACVVLNYASLKLTPHTLLNSLLTVFAFLQITVNFKFSIYVSSMAVYFALLFGTENLKSKLRDTPIVLLWWLTKQETRKWEWEKLRYSMRILKVTWGYKTWGFLLFRWPHASSQLPLFLSPALLSTSSWSPTCPSLLLPPYPESISRIPYLWYFQKQIGFCWKKTGL